MGEPRRSRILMGFADWMSELDILGPIGLVLAGILVAAKYLMAIVS